MKIISHTMFKTLTQKSNACHHQRNHSMLFLPSAQTASSVRVLITCLQCCKPRLIYSKHKLSGNQITSLKRLLNDCMYAFGTIFQDVPLDKGCRACFHKRKYGMQIKYRSTLLHLTIKQEDMHKIR